MNSQDPHLCRRDCRMNPQHCTADECLPKTRRCSRGTSAFEAQLKVVAFRLWLDRKASSHSKVLVTSTSERGRFNQLTRSPRAGAGSKQSESNQMLPNCTLSYSQSRSAPMESQQHPHSTSVWVAARPSAELSLLTCENVLSPPRSLSRRKHHATPHECNWHLKPCISHTN